MIYKPCFSTFSPRVDNGGRIDIEKVINHYRLRSWRSCVVQIVLWKLLLHETPE
jgi:hypothetical protein